MVKTLKVEGDALALVQEMAAHQAATNLKLDALKKDASDIVEAARRVEADQEARLKVLLGIAPDEHCHVDVKYLEEHGIAFARTGCGHGAGGALSDLLAKMMGGVKAADKPGVH